MRHAREWNVVWRRGSDMELLALSIGIGLVVSLTFAEFFGLAAGGMIVPGYFALSLVKPVDVIVTVGIAVATFAIVRLLSTVVIIYGKRRTVIMILIGYLLTMIMLNLFPALILPAVTMDMKVIGYIIPGLIAIWFDRQGIIETLSTLTIASVVVRLTIILIMGEELAR